MTTNRFSLIIALTVIAALAILTISMATLPGKKSVSSARVPLSVQARSLDQMQIVRGHRGGLNPEISHSISSSYDAEVELERAERYAAAAAQLAYLDQRRGEWMAGKAVAVSPAALPFREAEQIASAADSQRAYLMYREGEWNGGVSPAHTYLNYPPRVWTGLK